MKPQKLVVMIGVAVLVTLGVEYGIGKFHQTSLIFNLAIFLGAAQGCVALMAAAQLCEGKWAKPIRRHLLNAVPLILMCAFLYLLIVPQWKALYPDVVTNGHSKWFTGLAFCVGRNFALMVVSFIFAALYAKHSLAENEVVCRRYAVLYLFSYVICQTFYALDVVMPLEFPWFSTLFGASFFVEGLYLGLVIAAFISYAMFKQHGDNIPADVKKTQYDVSLLMHGFSILWTYMFFSQFLAIWYGNIPEEVLFFSVRTFEGAGQNVHMSKFVYIGGAAAVMLFLIPFVSLIFKRIKGNPRNMIVLGMIIIAGSILEKVYIIGGVPKMDSHHEMFSGRLDLNAVAVAIEFVLLASIYYMQFKAGFAQEEKAAA
ncbi:hypothetical protein [Candidatus Uabimicrobium amorphum]|uniref:Molybdopterin oxidoreductase n=1 Tax=Uabimicrobium amorphum TaxID=2596890 RepID=A0A5S9IUT6_UABAM|nr:hypothetical protein [Candidatus Uabimicrobium amorphum]BBM86995.1 hypothetical protein UABAM_05397 [Candidatus Uabimicrobium amorphum]